VTPADVIASVRVLTNDNDPVDYRYEDVTILDCVNRALRRMATLRPDLFVTTSELTCVAGVEQEVPNYGRVVQVFGVKDAGAVVETIREHMDAYFPSWRAAAAGTAVNWMRHSRNPSKFFVYPPASSGQVLDVEYSTVDAVYDTNTHIPLAAEYLPSLVDITAAEVEWADDEYVLTPRAEGFYNRAVQALAAQAQTRQNMDTEAGGGAPAIVD